MTKRMIRYWVIPPDQDAEFVAGMEEVLYTYSQPYNPNQPQLYMDEKPFQFVLETQDPLPATKAAIPATPFMCRKLAISRHMNGVAGIAGIHQIAWQCSMNTLAFGELE